MCVREPCVKCAEAIVYVETRWRFQRVVFFAGPAAFGEHARAGFQRKPLGNLDLA